MNKKTILAIALTGLAFSEVMAQQAPNLASGGRAFLDNTVKPLFPVVIVIVFIVVALFNIGLVSGQNKEWKKFGEMILIYAGSVIATMAMIAWLASRTI